MSQYLRLSKQRTPPGLVPYTMDHGEDRLYTNSYGGGYMSVQIDFNNALIQERYEIDDVINIAIKSENPCGGCGEDCELELRFPSNLENCKTCDDCVGVYTLCEALECGYCAGFVKCCLNPEQPEAPNASYILTSRHPGSNFSIFTSLQPDEYTLTVLSEATPFGMDVCIPVDRVVVQNNTLLYYDLESAHLPTGDVDTDVPVGITKAREIGLVKYEETENSCCECPCYKPCQPMCVRETGLIQVSFLNKYITQQDPIGFINDPTDPANGSLVFVNGTTTAPTQLLPNASIYKAEKNTPYVILSLK